MIKKHGSFVRITGGEFKGRKIRTPGGGTHPMGERERIALFNIIGDRIKGNYVMDLYCGGGTLMIEALSRGARWALGVDISENAVMTANENLLDLGLIGIPGAFGGGAVQNDIPKVMRTATDRYSSVIADPPYDTYDEKMVKYLPRVVFDGGMLIISHPGEAPKLRGVRLVDSRKYAGATLSFYIKD